MTTFLHRGLLNPPSGVEDFLSGGTISRAVEDVDYSLLYSLSWSSSSVTEGDTNTLSTFADVGGATQTGLTLTVVVGPIDPDGAIEDSPTPTVTNLNGWTLSTSGSTLGFSGDPGVYYYYWTFTRASLGVGSHSGPVIEVDTIEPGTAYVWFDGTNGSTEVPSPSGGGNGSSFTILAEPVFDALVTTPTHLSTWEIDLDDLASTPLLCTVTATASGQNQTNGYVKIEVYDSYGAGGLIDEINTTDAAGWTQTGSWTLDGMTGIWSGVFEKSTVNIGSYEIDFTIESGGNTGQVYIRTSGTAPQTSQDAGSGNEVEVDIDELADPISWTVDATSGGNVPANATEWGDFISYYSLSVAVPDYLHLCQESSGNLADSIGSLTLAPNGSPGYNQPLAGWSRTGVKGSGATSAQRFLAPAINPSTTAVARLALVELGTLDATLRGIMGNGLDGDASVGAYLNGSDKRLRYTEGSNTAETSGSFTTPGAVAFLNNAVDRARLFTASQTLSPTWGAASTTTSYWIGGRTTQWADSTIGYECGWTGSNADISDANMGALITALNW